MVTEAVGGVADEAAKLFGAVEDWWRERIGEVHQGPECAVCPVCQVLALVRTAKPEVFEHLAQSAASLLLAFQAAVDSPGAARRGASPVQRIDIG